MTAKGGCLANNVGGPQRDVNIVLGGIEYTGTLLAWSKGVLAILDPFEVSYVAARSITIATTTFSRGGDDDGKVRQQCEDPVPQFIRILKSLKGMPVLVQVDSLFVQGTVRHISKHNGQLALQGARKTITTVLVQNIVAILVPLSISLATHVAFGDPTSYQLTLKNATSAMMPVLVFQEVK